jgi:hypothetical protein
MKKIKFSELAHFWPKQKYANKISDEFKYTLFGGTMGPGKSYWLRWSAVRRLLMLFQKYKLQGIRSGLFCEDYPSLNDRHLSKIKYEFPEWLGDLNSSRHEYQIKKCYGGGVIAFRNLDDPSKYQSSEFADIGVDELTKNKKETFDFLRTRLRFPPIKEVRFRSASNPGGIGHAWVKGIWMDGVFEPTEQERDQFKYVKAVPEDNPALGEDYYKMFDGLPEKMRKAYKDGNWDVFEGQFFTEWDKSQHVIKPFKIPDTWKRFRSYDYGREKPAACSWYALDYDGRVYKYREFYKGGLNADEQAKEIIRLSGAETYEYSVADSAIFSPTGIIDKGGGETIAEVFVRNGIHFIPTSKRRVDGWNMVHQYLYWNNNQEPKFKIFETCYNTITYYPNLIHDEIKPEDVDSDSDDHLADTDRYFLMSLHERRSAQPLTEIEKKLKPHTKFNFNDFYLNKC